MSRGIYGRPIVGVGDVDYRALAVLRTFRGKLAHAIENTGAPDQMAVVIDSKPPPEWGTLGGDDLTLTPTNLELVNLAMLTGGGMPIGIERLPPAEWRSETETGRTRETVGQLNARVSAAIELISARVNAVG